MIATAANVESLVDEYSTFVSESGDANGDLPSLNWEVLQNLLTSWGDWTPDAAQTLVQLVRENGTFVLRNALALSIALGIEDGECGL